MKIRGDKKKKTTANSSEQFDSFAEELLEERSDRPLIIVGSSRI